MSVFLDPDCAFEELLAEIKEKFKQSAKFWGNAQMALILEGRTVTAEEELEIVNTITENSGIEVLCLIDQDANRIERCEKALNQKLMELSHQTGQFFKGDLHRGESLESEASIVIIGDVQHGARVTAKGSIIVLGKLRGNVHAGVSGNQEAVVAALDMAPQQLRIADYGKRYNGKFHRCGHGMMIAHVENCNIATKHLKKSFLNLLNFH